MYSSNRGLPESVREAVTITITARETDTTHATFFSQTSTFGIFHRLGETTSSNIKKTIDPNGMPR